MRFTHIDVQANAVNLAKRHTLQPLVQHANTVLFTLNGLTNNVRHAARADRQFLFTRG